MERALLDTDILSEVVKQRSAHVVLRAQQYRAEHGQFLTSAVTTFEIGSGLRRVGRHEQLARFLHMSPVEVLPFDASAAEVAGDIHGALEAPGQTIGIVDPMIAAIAISRGLAVATGNTAHFSRTQDLGFSLRLVNWRDPPGSQTP